MLLALAACNKIETNVQPVENNEGIPFSATISVGNNATTKALAESGSTIVATWAVDETVALIHNGVKDEMTVSAVNEGVATITGTIAGSPSDGDAVTVIYPASAADGTTGNIKADLLYAQNGLLTGVGSIAANYDARKGTGTLKVNGTTASLNGNMTLDNQFAIFKFTTKSVPGEGGSLQNTNMTELTVTTGGQNYVITPASATSTLYAALPAVDGQTVSFTATDGSNLYAASKASVSFDAAKYYQSTVKMGKVIEVFDGDEPYYDDFVSFNPLFHYLHIDLDQAYAIAKQLSTQNGGAPVAVIYNNDEMDVTCALSTDASATARTYDCWVLIAQYNYRAFLATLWESAQ